MSTLSRDEACRRIEEAGGAIVSAVSAKLDYLVAGSEAGSKLLKTLELGVTVIGEKQLQAMLPRLKTMITPAAADLLPPPLDSLEEAQRAAGIVPPQVTTDPPYRVCIKAHETKVGNTVPVGHVVTLEVGELLQQPACWAPCDKEGWVDGSINPIGIRVEIREPYGLGPLPPSWRPLPPKPSAIDEMAEQMKRWAAPTREDAQPVAWFDKDGKIQGRVSDEQLDALCEQAQADLEERNGWDASRQAHEDAYFESVKPTNPKDAAATDRVPLGLLSPIAKAHWALAQHCGRAKYGAWNWREAGVRASIYIDAIGRHTDGYLSGETYDPADGTHHLGNIMACCAILLEAEAAGKLTDDRPPTLDMRPTYAEVQRRLADLTTKYADRNPKHWTR